MIAAGMPQSATRIRAKLSLYPFPLGDKPAFSQADGKGHVYANIDKQEVNEITMSGSSA
jgi:hypothetical protein